ncbi:MAG: GTP 3',8-cyclase MoaA [Blastopirellula sp.]|nr:GTP 3',8-cyclase MoaA [Blastopirellula sp.]
MLVDSFGRIHDSLRISVTDRCNIRCFYCMPNENIQFLPREELLSFEELTRFAQIALQAGIRKFRLTGGEPLVRRDLPRLVASLRQLPGVEDLALTTNGVLLAEQVEALRAAGLMRLNVSLDSLRREVFEQITRRDELDRVLAGLRRAVEVGFGQIRINAVSIRGLTEADIVPLAEFCRESGHTLRFIEYMPLDADQGWTESLVLTGAKVRARLEEAFGQLEPSARTDPSQPAVDYRFADGIGTVGFINPVSEPFCGDCNRLRITAEGQLRNCLFSTEEFDVRALLRNGASAAEILELLRRCVGAKKAGHGINDPKFIRPQRAMYQIGG